MSFWNITASKANSLGQTVYKRVYANIFPSYTIDQFVLAISDENYEDLHRLIQDAGVNFVGSNRIFQDYGIAIEGCCPLHAASVLGKTDVCTFLIQHNADVNQTSEYGSAPLYFAALCGHSSTVQALLDNRADPNMICELTMMTPIQVAAEMKRDEVVTVLLDYDAKVKEQKEQMEWKATKRGREMSALK